ICMSPVDGSISPDKIFRNVDLPATGDIHITPGERLAVLKQNHFEYEEFPVLETVIMGHTQLYKVMQEKNAIYMKEDFSDEDGMRAAELEGEFAE
ncbi:hypothetical protein ACT453_46545, partial [Bacillus sp. D-CC]